MPLQVLLPLGEPDAAPAATSAAGARERASRSTPAAASPLLEPEEVAEEVAGATDAAGTRGAASHGNPAGAGIDAQGREVAGVADFLPKNPRSDDCPSGFLGTQTTSTPSAAAAAKMRTFLSYCSRQI